MPAPRVEDTRYVGEQSVVRGGWAAFASGAWSVRRGRGRARRGRRAAPRADSPIPVYTAAASGRYAHRGRPRSSVDSRPLHDHRRAPAHGTHAPARRRGSPNARAISDCCSEPEARIPNVTSAMSLRTGRLSRAARASTHLARRIVSVQKRRFYIAGRVCDGSAEPTSGSHNVTASPI